ncbi:DUF892 family protein [Mucilaginibacter kameinonensis]|uniref:DUF892 family protein n=1 Tax=Mucilaginibacter kameinonensis TaxID=452286 RepID=UPI000EF8243F|nr:DUF892 family protein [Mucilaginibacter kameinonensis]
MNLAKSKMRLFNGHLKLDNKSLKKVFLMQLDNIFMVKTYLVTNLPTMAEGASFKDLKNAILENVDDIKIQLLRLLVIYDIIGEKYKRSTITGIRGLIMEAYVVNKAADLSGFESDLMMLYHLNTLESIEISCFTCLHDIALAMPTKELTLLLKQNIDMAKDCKELYEMISREYLH